MKTFLITATIVAGLSSPVLANNGLFDADLGAPYAASGVSAAKATGGQAQQVQTGNRGFDRDIDGQFSGRVGGQVPAQVAPQNVRTLFDRDRDGQYNG